MNKSISLILPIVFISLFLISFVSAFPTQKQNTDINITQSSDSATYENITYIQLGDGSMLNIDSEMTKDGTFYNYTLDSDYTSSFGTYCIYGIGDDTEDPLWHFCFDVVGNGQDFTTAKAISYIGFIVILLFIFILITYGAIRVNWKHSRDEEGKILSINNFRYIKVFLFSMSYLLIMFLFGLSYKFFNEANIQGFTEFFNFIYQLLLNSIYPLIVALIIIMFVIWINNRKLSKKLKLGIK